MFFTQNFFAVLALKRAEYGSLPTKSVRLHTSDISSTTKIPQRLKIYWRKKERAWATTTTSLEIITANLPRSSVISLSRPCVIEKTRRRHRPFASCSRSIYFRTAEKGWLSLKKTHTHVELLISNSSFEGAGLTHARGTKTSLCTCVC